MPDTLDQTYQPSVSIILPTYNRAHVLPLAIHSILGQTYKDLELIIVSDNASDNTDEVVQTYNDPRLRYYRNEQNLRLPRTLNRGFSLARGKYLTWTSDDNIFAPQAIERMASVLGQTQANFVFADYHEFADTDSDGNPLGTKHVKLPDKPNHARGNSIGACFMYTRQVYEQVGDYDPKLFLNEDFDYWMRIARSFHIQHIAEPMYYFRRNEESLYCAHYSKVRAGSLLVRYKNHFLGPSEVLQGMTDQVLANLDKHHNRLVRYAYAACKKSSYRLTKAFTNLAQRTIQQQMKTDVDRILSAYDAETKDFGEARMALSEVMNHSAVIEYRDYIRT